ncbi:MAG: 30S ribosomal protein S4e [Candidatus Micrarchaeota archaeon]|nr:30S ribosomal protein S4e [Candidatus Micrarchaeota archaeon]
MAQRGPKHHLKRLSAPPVVRVLRKAYTYLLKPRAGPHPLKDSVALGVLLRDYLGIVQNTREAKYVLSQGKVKVDNRTIKDLKFPVGYQDYITIEGDKSYKVEYSKDGFALYPVEDTSHKMLKVIRKHKVKGGKLQLTFHDGRTYLTEDNTIKVGDTVVFDLGEKKIVKVIPQKVDSLCIITTGKHRGIKGRLIAVDHIGGKKIARLDTPEGEISTDYRYLFFLGDEA